MRQDDTISRRQFVAIAFVAIFSPLIRRFPRVLAETAGRTAWLSVPLAVVPLALTLCVAWLLFRKYPPGTGVPELLVSVLGRGAARVLCGVYGLWMALYAGFLLRSGANRFVSTVYPGSAPGLFVVCAALACALAALGTLKALARAAMLLRGLMVAIPALVFLLTLKDADFSLLLPVTAGDLPDAALGALDLTDLLGVAGYFAFFGDRVKDGPFRAADWLGWLGVLLGLVGLMTVGCLAMFGPELTGKMSYPFFMLARDVTILGALERVEPVVIALWVFADFILVSALLWLAGRNFRFAFALPDAGAVAKLTDFSRGRWLTPVCAALAIAVGLLLPGGAAETRLISERVVPLTSAALTFGVALLVLAVGRLRKKL